MHYDRETHVLINRLMEQTKLMMDDILLYAARGFVSEKYVLCFTFSFFFPFSYTEDRNSAQSGLLSVVMPEESTYFY